MLTAEKLTAFVLLLLTFLLALVAGFSLQWRMEHDAPLMLYFAYLVDHFDYIPYRDFFEHQPPGAHFAYFLIGKTFGYTDLAFRVFDLLYLGAILATSWFWLRNLGPRVAWAGAVLFGLTYLGYGPRMSVQRDFLMVLPVSAALLVQLRFPSCNEGLRAFLAAFLIGSALTIKPQIGLLFPAIVLFHVWSLTRRAAGGGERAASVPSVVLASVGGFVLPGLAVAFYLWWSGTLESFVQVVRGYWPLFGRLDGWHRTVSGFQRVVHLSRGFREFGGHGLWFAPAILGIFVSLFQSNLAEREKGQVVLLGLLGLLASLFALSSGRFWDYHWLLFVYFVLPLASLCLVCQREVASKSQRFFPLLVLLAVVLANVHQPRAFMLQAAGEPPHPPKKGRVDEIAAYLEANLRPGDKVQPLDWTGGAVHAMLIAGAEPATPYVTDFYFYHHVSDRYIQSLRRDFIASLSRAKPRFIIRVDTDRPWPTGRDTSESFEALEEILARDYRVDFGGRGYRIYLRGRV